MRAIILAIAVICTIALGFAGLDIMVVMAAAQGPVVAAVQEPVVAAVQAVDPGRAARDAANARVLANAREAEQVSREREAKESLLERAEWAARERARENEQVARDREAELVARERALDARESALARASSPVATRGEKEAKLEEPECETCGADWVSRKAPSRQPPTAGNWAQKDYNASLHRNRYPTTGWAQPRGFASQPAPLATGRASGGGLSRQLGPGSSPQLGSGSSRPAPNMNGGPYMSPLR